MAAGIAAWLSQNRMPTGPLRFRAGNRQGAGSTPGAYSETIEARAAIARRQLGVGGGIVPVDAAAEHGDGEAPGVERAPVRMAVDPACQAADHHEPGGGELAAEHPRDLGAVRRARAGADDRDRGAVEDVELALPRTNRPAGVSKIAPRAGGKHGDERGSQRRPRCSSRPGRRARRTLERSARNARSAARRSDASRCAPRTRPVRARSLRLQLRWRAVGERLRDVFGKDVVGARERGDRLRGPGDTCPAAARERQAFHGTSEQLVGRGVPARHPGPEVLSRCAYPLANRRGRLGRARRQLDASRPRNGDDQVEAVE